MVRNDCYCSLLLHQKYCFSQLYSFSIVLNEILTCQKKKKNTVFPFSSLHKMASEDLAISRLVFHLIANNIFIDLEEQDGKEKKGKEWFCLHLGKNTFWMKSKTSQWRNPFCHI